MMGIRPSKEKQDIKCVNLSACGNLRTRPEEVLLRAEKSFQDKLPKWTRNPSKIDAKAFQNFILECHFECHFEFHGRECRFESKKNLEVIS